MGKSNVLCAHEKGYSDIKVPLGNYPKKEFANASTICKLFERL